LKCLLDDVQSGRADFNTVLVYDVSRWGRFQDADESAYYEYTHDGVTVPDQPLAPSAVSDVDN
jgi:DNA invertase Pin-like site-specific DNA recombinase